MRQFIVIFSIISVSCSALGSPSGERKAFSGRDGDFGDNIKEMSEILYSGRKQTLEPNETFELLNQMEQHYRILQDEESTRKYSKIMSLINAKQVGKNYCNSYRGGFSGLEQDNSMYPNIKAYLDSVINHQSEICKALLDESIKRNIDDVSEYVQDDVNELRYSIVTENNLKPIGIHEEPPRQAIAGGFLLFLERKFGPLVPKMIPEEEGKKIYRRYADRVFSICRQVSKKLEEAMQIHGSFSFDEKELDKFAIGWLENGSICKAIRSDSDSVYRESYQMLLDKVSKSKAKFEQLITSK